MGAGSLVAGLAVAATPASAATRAPLEGSDPVVVSLVGDALGFQHVDAAGIEYLVDAIPLVDEGAGAGAAYWLARDVGLSTLGVELGQTEGELRLGIEIIDGTGSLEILAEDPIDWAERKVLLNTAEPQLSVARLDTGTAYRLVWAFTAAGVYEIRFDASIELADGSILTAQPTTHRIAVTTVPSPEPTDSPATAPTATPEPTVTPDPDPSSTPEPAAGPDPAEKRADDLDATPALDPAIAPVDPLPAPDGAGLTDANRGGVALGVESVSPGASVTVTVPADFAEQWISIWLLQPATDLGWKQVAERGATTAIIPEAAQQGDNRVVVRDREGELIGWAALRVAPAEAAIEECIPTPITTTIRPENVGVVASGHLDFGPVIEGGSMRGLLKDDRSSPAQWVDAGSLVMHVSDAAAVQAPGGAFSFLGGGTVWQIPLTQNPSVPWLGWNTQHPTIAGRTQGDITLTLEGVEGPGGLAVYSLDSFGGLGARYFGTVDGFPRSTAISVGGSGVHVHGIWAFTQPGAYYVTMTFSGTVDGQPRSGTSILTFFVGAGDPTSAVREQTVTTYVGRTPSGKECVLTLAQTGFVGDSADVAGLAGALLVVGVAFLGASALAPRRRQDA